MSKTFFLEVISFFWHMWLEVGVRWATCWRKLFKLFKVREVGVMMSLGGRKCHFDIAFDNTSSPRAAIGKIFSKGSGHSEARERVDFLAELPEKRRLG